MGRRRQGRGGRRLARVLLTLATLGVLLCIPGSASAAWCEDKAPVPDFSEDHQPLFVPERMERPGLEDFMTDWNYIGRWGSWADDSQPNDMAEKYWTSGAKWHVVLEGCTDPMRWDPEPKLYNMFWGWSKTITNFALAAVFMGLFPETVGFFGHMMATVIDTLKETVFWQFFSAMVILGALWMGWQGLIAKRFTLTVQGAVWMCISAALGMWVMASPNTFFGATVQLSNVGAAGATNIMSASASDNPDQEYTCLKGERWGSDTEKMDDPTVDAARLYQTAVWQTLVCEPWKKGMFGSGSSAESIADEYGKEFWKLQSSSGSVYDEDEQAEIDDEWTAMADEIAEKDSGVHTVLIGRNSAVRTDAAISAFGASIILGAVLGVVAFSVAILRVAVMFMLAISPVVFVFGIHPGWGRPVVRRYFEMLGGLAIKQLVLLSLMGVLLVAFRLVVASPLPWRMHILLYLLILVIAIVGRKRALAKFAEVIGGAQSAAGRMVKSAAEDRTLEHASGFTAWNATRKKSIEWAKKAAGITLALNGMPGGLGALGGNKGPKTKQGPSGRTPEEAPPMDGTKWSAEDTTAAARPSRPQRPGVGATGRRGLGPGAEGGTGTGGGPGGPSGGPPPLPVDRSGGGPGAGPSGTPSTGPQAPSAPERPRPAPVRPEGIRLLPPRATPRPETASGRTPDQAPPAQADPATRLRARTALRQTVRTTERVRHEHTVDVEHTTRVRRTGTGAGDRVIKPTAIRRLPQRRM